MSVYQASVLFNKWMTSSTWGQWWPHHLPIQQFEEDRLEEHSKTWSNLALNVIAAGSKGMHTACNLSLDPAVWGMVTNQGYDFQTLLLCNKLLSLHVWRQENRWGSDWGDSISCVSEVSVDSHQTATASMVRTRFTGPQDNLKWLYALHPPMHGHRKRGWPCF